LTLLVVAAGAAARVQATSVVSVTPGSPTTTDAVVIGAQVDLDPATPSLIPEFFLDRTGNTFTITTAPITICPAPPGPVGATFNVGTLPSGLYHVALRTADTTTSVEFTVSDPQVLAFGSGRFLVKLLHGATVTASTVSGGHPSPSVQISDQSGYFWFFGSASMELTVKLVDGRAVNGHFWLFAASMTTEPYVLEVTDTAGACSTPPCTKLYANAAGSNRNIIDLEAF
jgi:hypothetical protein